jgi:hypothetical protein
MEGLHRPLFGEKGGQELAVVHVGIIHRDHVPSSLGAAGPPA